MLAAPDAADWLLYSRTYDAQRFSPLDQINRGNVADLELAWTKPIPDGVIEVIPVVHDGVMYLPVPAGGGGGGRGRGRGRRGGDADADVADIDDSAGEDVAEVDDGAGESVAEIDDGDGAADGGGVMAIDATTGETLWHYRPERPLSSRAKSISIYADLILFSAPAGGDELEPVIALDARTGELRWSTPVTEENHTAGTLVADGKVISGRTCNSSREQCYIVAHDALTGEEVWRFHTTPGAGERGDESWAGTPVSERRASTWGLPGGYDPELGLVYWGISNPMPNTRAARHDGNPRAISDTAPADLYSNSTVALDVDTGELVWYYQHLPGDDWDMDINHEKVLLSTALEPDPAFVKWISPNFRRGEVREVLVTSGEGGGFWVNDARTGEFLWAMPFPYDTPNFILSDIDVETGATKINWDNVLTEPGANRTICYWNTRNYWPSAYHPGENSIYIPYFDYCLSMTRATEDPDGEGEGEGEDERRTGARRPGSDPGKFAGIAKIDMRTGEITRFNEGRVGGNGAMLATAGNLLFWGDILHVLHAFDVATGEELWRSEPLGATIMTSTITYAVDGRQYVAVVNGDSTFGSPRTMAEWGGIELPEDRGNFINVFALPD
jgi:alcohol dehydrogenase (cytochrome c)